MDRGAVSQRRPETADPAAILDLYAKRGPGCVNDLLGDFAFALWDERAKRLFCARDPLGCRPFHYHLTPERMVFATRLDQVLATPGVSRAPDDAVLAARLCGDQLPLDRTEYADVRRLPPGHAMLVEPDRVKIWRYWRPENAPDVRYRNEADYVERLRELLDQAIGCRLDASSAVGAHFSGGLDSSGIGVLAARRVRATGARMETFAWSPPIQDGEHLDDGDERALIRLLCDAERDNISHHPTDLDTGILGDCARLLLRPYGQPSAGFPQEHIVRRRARALGIGVLLSGWGGDEFVTFNGRGVFAHWLRSGHWLHLLRELWLRQGIQGHGILNGLKGEALLPLIPDWMVPWFPARRLRKDLDPRPRFLPILQPELAARLEAQGRFPHNLFRLRAGTKVNQLGLLALGHLTERIEAWAQEEPEQGIEYRYPLLDQRLIEFSLGLPPELTFKNGWKRYLYRTAMTGVLPPEVQWCKMKDDPARFAQHMALQDELAQRVLRPVLHALQSGTTALVVLDRHGLRRLLGPDSKLTVKPNKVIPYLRAERMLNPAVGPIIDAHIEAAERDLAR